MKGIFIILIGSILLTSSFIKPPFPESTPESSFKIKGLNFVAPPSSFTADPMEKVLDLGSNWIAVVPFAYTQVYIPKVYYNVSGYQWWGETPEGVKKTISLAKESGLKVLLKPQVYVPGSWPGGLEFKTEKDWLAWENEYEKYIMQMLDIANSTGVDALCIGTEFKISTRNRPFFWNQLITKIRAVYDGKLTYAANWDEYKDISFWKSLDFAGIDAYFPLVNEKTPSVESLKKAWQPHLEQLRAFHQKIGRPLVFTEFGYLSVDGCAYNTWELESKVKQLPINEQAQANAIDGLFSVFWDEPYWMGGFLWKWFPNDQGHEGYFERDYTPQGKKAQEVIEKWYWK